MYTSNGATTKTPPLQRQLYYDAVPGAPSVERSPAYRRSPPKGITYRRRVGQRWGNCRARQLLMWRSCSNHGRNHASRRMHSTTPQPLDSHQASYATVTHLPLVCILFVPCAVAGARDTVRPPVVASKTSKQWCPRQKRLSTTTGKWTGSTTLARSLYVLHKVRSTGSIHPVSSVSRQ